MAAWRLSEGLPCNLEVSTAKAWTSDAHDRICWHAHGVFGGVGSTVDDGVLPLYTFRSKVQQLYLGDAVYHLGKVADEVEKFPPPEKSKGKPLGIWNPELRQIPTWQPWRDYFMKKYSDAGGASSS